MKYLNNIFNITNNKYFKLLTLSIRNGLSLSRQTPVSACCVRMACSSLLSSDGLANFRSLNNGELVRDWIFSLVSTQACYNKNYKYVMQLYK